MATRAVYSFLGFPGWAPLHLALEHDVDPAGAALRLSLALGGRDGTELPPEPPRPPLTLLKGFLRCHREGVPLTSPESCRDCDDRYLVVCRPGGRVPLRISAWHRRTAGGGWQRRCGPMPLDDFLRRFRPRWQPPPLGHPGAGHV